MFSFHVASSLRWLARVSSIRAIEDALEVLKLLNANCSIVLCN
jgi:hypothetical protein